MRKIFLIGIKDVKIRARDSSSFIMLLAMPLLLILVLGMVFQPLWTSTPFTIEIAVLDEDGGEFSKILLEEVEFLCDRVAVVDMGKIIAQGTQNK